MRGRYAPLLLIALLAAAPFAAAQDGAESTDTTTNEADASTSAGDAGASVETSAPDDASAEDAEKTVSDTEVDVVVDARPPPNAPPMPPGDQPAMRCEPEGELMRCALPEHCLADAARLPECAPPPDCRALEGLEMLCRPAPMPTGGNAPGGPGAPGAPGGDFGQNEVERAIFDEVRREIRATIKDRMEEWRDDLQRLRGEFTDDIQLARDAYDSGRADAKAQYDACLAAIPEDAEPADAKATRAECVATAKAALSELRSEARLAKATILRDVRARLTELESGVCNNIKSDVTAFLEAAGMQDLDLRGFVGPGDLGKCAQRLGGFAQAAMQRAGEPMPMQPPPPGGERPTPIRDAVKDAAALAGDAAGDAPAPQPLAPMTS